MDRLEHFEGSLIQHGKFNNRVYLMKLGNTNIDKIINYIESLAVKNNYAKIFIKVPAWTHEKFSDNGYCVEARAEKFFSGEIDALFMCKYYDKEIEQNKQQYYDEVSDVIKAAKLRMNSKESLTTEDDFSFDIDKAAADDLEEIAEIYKEVFITYPFPIQNINYLKEVMNDNVAFYCAKKQGKIAAVASAELDFLGKNAEMTDFATRPEFRGQKLASYILNFMEKDVAMTHDIKTVYTIARAKSYAMNITFAKLDYLFGGTLIKNTNICGTLESMNVWYKPLIVTAQQKKNYFFN